MRVSDRPVWTGGREKAHSHAARPSRMTGQAKARRDGGAWKINVKTGKPFVARGLGRRRVVEEYGVRVV
eukprot:6202830-Pleurochrysis_carterae.AAC.5